MSSGCPDPTNGYEYRQASGKVVFLQTLALLVHARELIDLSTHWTRRAYARNRQSRPVSPMSQTACRFCAAGALMRAEGDLSGLTLDDLEQGYGYVGPQRFTYALELVSNRLFLRYSERADPADLGRSAAPLTWPDPTTFTQRRERREALLNLIDPLNDIKVIKHADVLTAYNEAISFCDNLRTRWLHPTR